MPPLGKVAKLCHMGVMIMSLGLALAAASANPSVAEQLRALQAQDQRVANIAYQLATRNAASCKKRRAWSGFVIHEPGQYAPNARVAAETVFGFSGHPAVLALVPGSPAALAGLKQDDLILAINGITLTAANAGKASYSNVASIKERLASEIEKGAITILTSNGPRTIGSEPGCISDVEIVPGRKLNAHADGEIAQLSSAVVNEAADDDELAFVIAHELAHNILEHPQQLSKGKRGAGRILQTEVEADRMALSLMKRAGFDPTAAARFWARFGAKTGHGIFSDGTHMRTKQRVAFLQQVAASLTGGSGSQ